MLAEFGSFPRQKTRNIFILTVHKAVKQCYILYVICLLVLKYAIGSSIQKWQIRTCRDVFMCTMADRSQRWHMQWSSEWILFCQPQRLIWSGQFFGILIIVGWRSILFAPLGTSSVYPAVGCRGHVRQSGFICPVGHYSLECTTDSTLWRSPSGGQRINRTEWLCTLYCGGETKGATTIRGTAEIGSRPPWVATVTANVANFTLSASDHNEWGPCNNTSLYVIIERLSK